MTAEQKASEVNVWAWVLEEVERLDKIERAEIIKILDWLLKENTFWIHGGPLQGLSALRKKGSGGTRKLDTIVGQFNRQDKGRQAFVAKPKHGDKFTEYDVVRVKEAYPELATNFKRFPIDEAQREYVYHEEG
jgi:hypothetical protein